MTSQIWMILKKRGRDRSLLSHVPQMRMNQILLQVAMVHQESSPSRKRTVKEMRFSENLMRKTVLTSLLMNIQVSGTAIAARLRLWL